MCQVLLAFKALGKSFFLNYAFNASELNIYSCFVVLTLSKRKAGTCLKSSENSFKSIFIRFTIKQTFVGHFRIFLINLNLEDFSAHGVSPKKNLTEANRRLLFPCFLLSLRRN